MTKEMSPTGWYPSLDWSRQDRTCCPSLLAPCWLFPVQPVWPQRGGGIDAEGWNLHQSVGQFQDVSVCAASTMPPECTKTPLWMDKVYLFLEFHTFSVVRFSAWARGIVSASACTWGSQRHRKERQHRFGGEKLVGSGDLIAFRNCWREGIIGYVCWKQDPFGCCGGTLAQQSFTFALHSVDVVSPILNHHQVRHLGDVNYIQSIPNHGVKTFFFFKPRVNNII